MGIGVFSYSFAIGTINSILGTIDKKKLKLTDKLDILEEFKRQYKLNHDIYIRLKKSFKYDYINDESEKIAFLNELPPSLKLEFAVIVHQTMIKKIPFFQMRDPEFIASITKFLRPVKYYKNEFLYREGDPIENVFFIVNGSVSLVLPEYENAPYVKIQDGYFFGEADIMDGNGLRKFTVMASEDSEMLAISKDVRIPLILE